MNCTEFEDLDAGFSNFEKSLNVLGYIPLVSTLTGLTRAIYGVAQTCIGYVACAFKSFLYFFSGNPHHRDQAAAYFWYAQHGEMNFQRGWIEALPFVGNITTLFYDRLFRLRVNYTFEPLPPNIRPIYDASKAISSCR